MSARLSVVVPVYNSEGTLRELTERLASVLPQIAAEYELILVNDGSVDDSWRVVEELIRTYPWVRGINLMRNYGQHNALLCGIRMAVYEVAVTIDDDLQNPPEEIPKLLAKLNEGFDVVYGKPVKTEQDLWRWAATRVTKVALQPMMGEQVASNVSAFRALNTGVREGFDRYYAPFVNLDVLLTWGTSRFAAVPVAHHPRTVGRSNYTVAKLARHALNMMTGFSVLPLQLASMIGFAFTAIGFLLFLYVIGRYLIQGVSVPGFPFLATVIVTFSGAQLFALGIIGEYLARIHFRVMDRPAYVVRHEASSVHDPLAARLASHESRK
ncbi:MAG TPA: glycosyltransferase family 2 protein [Candidatus Solibacter sp.]|nr:glycosyltransferase family 2 protein [Candidatus Solibacter sp.]